MEMFDISSLTERLTCRPNHVWSQIDSLADTLRGIGSKGPHVIHTLPSLLSKNKNAARKKPRGEQIKLDGPERVCQLPKPAHFQGVAGPRRR
jgi:hypothetical protein